MALAQNIILTNVGLDAIKQTKLLAGKTTIGGVRFGSSANLALVPTVVNVAGTVVYTASVGQIYYSVIGDHEVILKVVLDHSVGGFDVGSFAFLNNAGVPLWVGRFEYVHKKYVTAGNKAGGRLVVQFRLVMQDILEHFSFANLNQRYTEFDFTNSAIEDAPEYPVWSLKDQLQLDTLYVSFGRKGFPLTRTSRGNSWVTSPFQMRSDDLDFFGFDGGEDGDSHEYVARTESGIYSWLTSWDEDAVEGGNFDTLESYINGRPIPFNASYDYDGDAADVQADRIVVTAGKNLKLKPTGAGDLYIVFADGTDEQTYATIEGSVTLDTDLLDSLEILGWYVRPSA